MAIIKILSRSTPSYGQLIDYITKQEKGKDGKSILITHNLKGNSKEEWIKEFCLNESFRRYVRENKTYLYHEIVSFSANEKPDSFTPPVMEDLAKKYIELRGKDGMYIIAYHSNQDNIHFHVMSSGLKFRTGLAHRLSTQDLRILKNDFQEYHKRHHDLSFSNPDHSKGKDYISNAEYYAKNKRTNVKESLKRQIQNLFKESNDREEFLTKLVQNNLPYYERHGRPAGIITEQNIKFRWSNLEINLYQKDRNAELLLEEEKVLNELAELRAKGIDRDMDQEFEFVK